MSPTFLPQVTILGTTIDNLTMTELLNALDRGIVFTPNVDHIMRLRKTSDFREAYKAATFSVCDSKIVIFAAQFLGTPLKEKI